MLKDTYTSSGAKFFAHEEAMTNLQNGQGQPIVTHVMLTDICNHSCAFCSVQARAGDSLPFDDVMGYLDILLRHGLKAVILSGGGNPILYKCKKTGKNFNDVVDAIHSRGLEIGLITNGMPLRQFEYEVFDEKEYAKNACPPTLNGRQHCSKCCSDTSHRKECPDFIPWNFPKVTRQSWATIHPNALDKLTWVRISMAGLDHDEREVYVPDIDSEKTTLGFSYVAHDLYQEPADPHHGKVSRPLDFVSGAKDRLPDWPFESRICELTEEITSYARKYNPKYVRLLPNCLEPDLILRRCEQLSKMARVINCDIGREVAFVQYKPPKAPNVCLLGSVHPVLNCDGFCYPCDSCVLNESAGHTFANPWRMCHWSEISKLYEGKLPHSLIDDPSKQCPGCVFTKSNEILEGIRDDTVEISPLEVLPEHHNFV